MKKTLFVISLLVLAANAHADVSGKYTKSNGEVVIRQRGQNVEFTINAVAGSSSMPSSCGLEGQALLIDATRATFTPEDKTDTCSAELRFEGDRLSISTRRCDAHCGVRAMGSMEGTYQKKPKR
ncbi:hypothetical protein Q9Q94_04795 [Uliginosibacterium sp. 31-16]|uniref:hypothetical protein n=1 Tax=Uliginosibacterium sp. 31-16 TaxID=3068315 RepID=UPI00273F51B6|nr:hypothetical protein [Uliginosibacterium sp. 31-16]MDP5238833.1 hypothetical protein [Uliginosibacterium sp. 31-16]